MKNRNKNKNQGDSQITNNFWPKWEAKETMLYELKNDENDAISFLSVSALSFFQIDTCQNASRSVLSFILSWWKSRSLSSGLGN